MATDETHTTKVSYVALIAMMLQQKARLKPFVGPNGEMFQALNRCLKDLPKDNENAQRIAEGLRHYRNSYNIAEHNIQVLQRAIKEKEVQ